MKLLLNTDWQSLHLIVAMNLSLSGSLFSEHLLLFGIEVLAIQWVEVVSLPIFNCSLGSLDLKINFVLDVVIL